MFVIYQKSVGGIFYIHNHIFFFIFFPVVQCQIFYYIYIHGRGVVEQKKTSSKAQQLPLIQPRLQ